MTRVTAFPPLVGREPRVLILGSLPGIASLDARQYYAHPRNLFWSLMGDLFGAHPSLSYDERCRVLTSRGVAVWDVAREARRPGSLDADIESATLVANDFVGLFAAHSDLRAIAFNGQMSATLFRRHVAPVLPPEIALRRITLPSTSPAHAGRTRDQKLTAWRVLLVLAGQANST